MKKIIVNKSFMGILAKLVENNQSIVFPESGSTKPGTKFGNIRKESSSNPMILTTKRVEISIVRDGIRIFNPLNKGFGYADLVIPFGSIISSYGSFFWKDEYGIWRQMKFSKNPGWALKLSGGRTEIFNN
jgi:hypothetical protein